MKGLSNQAIGCSLCPAANGGPFSRDHNQLASPGHMAGSPLEAWLCMGGQDGRLQEVPSLYPVCGGHADAVRVPKPARMCHIICPGQRKISLWF